MLALPEKLLFAISVIHSPVSLSSAAALLFSFPEDSSTI